MQPSESMRSKVSEHTFRKISSALFESTTASVVITESIVASDGASMPAPFAIPKNLAPCDSIEMYLDLLSVVIIASANCSAFSESK